MELVKTSCPGCGANIDIDFDKIVKYCPYCGSALTLDIESAAELLKEKEKTKQVKHKTEAQIEKARIKREEEREARKNIRRILIFYGLLAIVALVFAFYITH